MAGRALFIRVSLVFSPIIPIYMRARHGFEVRGVRDACAVSMPSDHAHESDDGVKAAYVVAR